MSYGTLPKSIAAFREKTHRKEPYAGVTTIRHRCSQCARHMPAYRSMRVNGKWHCLDCVGGND